MNAAVEIIPLYEAQYTRLAHLEIDLLPTSRSSQVYVGQKSLRRCRLCERSAPHVSFRTRAHLFPQALGNRDLFTYEECDACNTLRGSRLEDDLVKLLAPLRPFLPVPTAKGGASHRVVTGGAILSTARESDGRLAYGDVNITLVDGDASIEVINTGPRSQNISVVTQKFRIGGVVKALARMAYHAIDAGMLPPLAGVRRWILDGSLAHCVLGTRVAFGEGIRSSKLYAYVLEAKEGMLPYLVVYYNVCGIMLAGFCPTRDGGLPTIFPVPQFQAIGASGRPLRWQFFEAKDMTPISATLTIESEFDHLDVSSAPVAGEQKNSLKVTLD